MPDFKFSCPNCGQHISCDTGYSGMQVNCPNCKQAIVVPQAPAAAAAPSAPRIATPPPPSVPPALGTRQSTAAPAAGQRFAGAGAPPPKKSGGVLKMLAIVLAALIGLAGGFFGVTFALKHFGSGSKSGGNPEAQVAAPTAAATVQALSILTKVHSAYTNLASVKAEGTFTAFLDLSNITVADVNPRAATTGKNAERHPPGMPKVITNATEFTIKRSGTNLYYIAGEAVSKLDRQTMTNTFAFWKSDKGQFTFTDMHQPRTAPMYRQLPDFNPANGQAEQIKQMQGLFADPANLTKLVKDLGQTADESVNGQSCYTLTAKVLGQKVKIWVDKTSYLIPQWQITLGGEVSDADIDDVFSLVAAGFTNIPPAGLEMAKAQVKKMAPILTKIRGTIASTTGELEQNPTFASDDFDYPVPAGIRLVQMPSPANASTPAQARQRNACINNLRQIDSAKQQWALEKGKGPNDTPTQDDLKPYLGPGPNGTFPICPSGGKYTIGKVSEPPTCSIPGHSLPQ